MNQHVAHGDMRADVYNSKMHLHEPSAVQYSILGPVQLVDKAAAQIA